MSGRGDDLLYMDLPGLGFPASVQSIGTDTGLTERAVGRFTLLSPGPYSIRVHGEYEGPGGDRGPYRIYLYPIDRRPEGASANLLLGDSATASIELPGDIDDYTLAVPDAGLANVVLWRDPTGRGSFLTLGIDDPFKTCGGGLEVVPGQVVQGRGTSLLSAGPHRISVCGADSYGFGYRGGYKFATFAIDSLPETRSDTIAIGDTIETEGIELPGDRDEFVFYGARGQHIDVLIQGQAAAPSAGVFYLRLDGPSILELAATGTLVSAPTLSGQRTHRIDLPTSGWHRITIAPLPNGGDLLERGAYRFAVVRVPGNPETVSPNLAPGDSVTMERLEDVDDVDEYVLTGNPNQELAVFLYAGEIGGLTAALYDTGTEQIQGSVTSGGIRRESSGRFFLPDSGVLGVRVYSPRPCPPEISSCGHAGAPGLYFLQIFPINRAPESAPAVVAVGDTTQEAIDPRGDIDEFTFSGTAGDTVTVIFDTPFGVGAPGFVLQVLDSASNSVIGSAVSWNPSSTFGDVNTGPIRLPRTGSYLLRVQGVSDRECQGTYKFLIK